MQAPYKLEEQYAVSIEPEFSDGRENTCDLRTSGMGSSSFSQHGACRIFQNLAYAKRSQRGRAETEH